MTNPLVLYTNSFWTSPYVFACFVALREKGIPFEARDVALHAREQQRPEYIARTLTGRVPALEHDGFVVTESMAILEYLEEAFPGTPSALPREPRERARARQILSWIRSDETLAIREERSAEKIFYPHTRAANAPLSENARRAAEKLFVLARGVLPAGRRQLFGAFCVADADLAFFVQRLVTSGDPVPTDLAAFAAEHWRRPSVKEWVDHKRPEFVPY
jgi:glutathione S-transferase